MSEKAYIEYVIYKGEKPNGSVVVKSERPNSPFRVFSYTKGVKYRVGVGINPNQAKFLTRNHSDLFLLERQEMNGVDLVYKELEEIIPRFKREFGNDPAVTLRCVLEACMGLMNIDYNKSETGSILKVILGQMVSSYQKEIDPRKLKDIFKEVSDSIIDLPEKKEEVKEEDWVEKDIEEEKPRLKPTLKKRK